EILEFPDLEVVFELDDAVDARGIDPRDDDPGKVRCARRHALAVDDRGGSRDAGHLSNDLEGRVVVGPRRLRRSGDDDRRIVAANLSFQILAKAAHHGDDAREGTGRNGGAANREYADAGEKAALLERTCRAATNEVKRRPSRRSRMTGKRRAITTTM